MLSLSHVPAVLLRTVLQENLKVISQTFLGIGGDGHVGTGDLGVSNSGRNELGGIGPQLLGMAVDGEVG